jgi:hypothetical protein
MIVKLMCMRLEGRMLWTQCLALGGKCLVDVKLVLPEQPVYILISEC